jgi:hypothetical protein
MTTKEGSQGGGKGCVITLFSLGVLLPTFLAFLALLGSDYQWMMFKTYIFVFPFAIFTFVLAFWKPLIGGILLTITGLCTMIVPSAITINTPGIEQGVFLTFPLAIFIGGVLLSSGILFIKYRNVR